VIITGHTVTAEQIERTVERMTDSADRAFMGSRITQAEYDARMKYINDWAERAYSRITVTAHD
jgi:predicted secreted protein